MGSIKTSPQSINLLLVSLLLVPRFFSEAAYQTGTVLILIFWIVPFVIISEMASEDWYIKSKLSELPKSTSSILVICLILIFASFYWRKIIYADVKEDVGTLTVLRLINSEIEFFDKKRAVVQAC